MTTGAGVGRARARARARLGTGRLTRGLLAAAVFALPGCGEGGPGVEGDTGEAAPASAAPDPADFAGPPVSAAEAPTSHWDSVPDARWRLEEELRIGSLDGEGPEVFGSVRNVVPAQDGGVWVFDVQASELRRFAADGRHVVSVGRRGGGPGEFEGNACARPGPPGSGEVWVETETNWHRFDDVTGELRGTFRPSIRGACAWRVWLPDGRYLAANARFDREADRLTTFLTRHEWTGEELLDVDTVAAPELPEVPEITFRNGNRRSTGPIPFTPMPRARPQPDGTFLVWDGGGDYALRQQTLDGEVLRTVARPWVPVRISAEERREAMDRFQRPGWEQEPPVRRIEVPEVHPPFSNARLGPDGTIWVNRVVEGGFAWDVFDAEGRWLGELAVPEALAGFSLRSIDDDGVWGIVRDEFDVQYVVRARLVRGTG